MKRYKKMRIYVDVDGTLTDCPTKIWGRPRPEIISRVQQLIDQGHEVVIWSAGGRDYVTDFCYRNNIRDAQAHLGKPNVCIDDCDEINPNITVLCPEEIDKLL